mgnify:CR=1 FL=1
MRHAVQAQHQQVLPRVGLVVVAQLLLEVVDGAEIEQQRVSRADMDRATADRQSAQARVESPRSMAIAASPTPTWRASNTGDAARSLGRPSFMYMTTTTRR